MITTDTRVLLEQLSAERRQIQAKHAARIEQIKAECAQELQDAGVTIQAIQQRLAQARLQASPDPTSD